MTHAEESIINMYFSRIDEILNDDDETYTQEERINDLQNYTFLIQTLLKQQKKSIITP
jgi:hypothetical protein